MNDYPREQLCRLIRDYGHDLCADPERLKAWLQDFCGGQYVREVNVLHLALTQGIPAYLLNNVSEPYESVAYRLSEQLQDDFGIVWEIARWAVDSWALALGIVQTLPALPDFPLQSFNFETVTVDSYGNIICKERKQARQIVENLGNGVVLEMVYIPGGIFLMGGPLGEEDSDDDEKPQHSVTIQPFYMGKYPVTQAQYQTLMGDNPAEFKGDNRPVERVPWRDAVNFCQKLSQRTGKTYQLPSEAQWEYACRAGTTTPFYFGETITPDLVNYNGNDPYANAPKGKYREETTSVGSFPPNGFGLYDMHGNVYEWCQDVWHDNYVGAGGACWESSGYSSYHVLRGGSWYYYARGCRSAVRGMRGDLNDYGGFRVVLR